MITVRNRFVNCALSLWVIGIYISWIVVGAYIFTIMVAENCDHESKECVYVQESVKQMQQSVGDNLFVGVVGVFVSQMPIFLWLNVYKRIDKIEKRINLNRKLNYKAITTSNTSDII